MKATMNTQEPSPPVTVETVGWHFYQTEPLAQHAVRSGISQQELIILLLREKAEMERLLAHEFNSVAKSLKIQTGA